MDKFVGKRLDARYEIREIIGIGGMAVVYKAYDCIDDRIVAIKILKEEFVRNSEFLNRFRNESKAIAVLSHPNIVKVIDVSFGDNFQYIVMEYIDGITLKEFMQRQGALSWKDTLYFTVQILRALQHAHDKGIVHRDVKPQNIMLLSDGTIKVTDFGIARFARSGQNTLTDKAIGSVHYISPEQARGDVIDEKADLYSVGVMMYEMLTGKLPFDGGNAVSVALMHMNNEPEAPRKIKPDIPAGLEQVVLRAMRKKPAYRYHSDAEIMHDLEQIRRDPTVTFKYDDVQYVDDSPTRFVNLNNVKPATAPANEAPVNSVAQKVGMLYGDDEPVKEAKPEYKVLTNSVDNDDYDDDDVEPKKSSIVPILAGIATVMVIAIAVVLVFVFKAFNDTGESTGSVRCPQLVGTDYDDACAKYRSINIIITDYEYSDEYPVGAILYQSEEEDKFLRKDLEVEVVVSLGKKTKLLPDIYEKTEDVAVGIIDGFGLEYVVQYEHHAKIKKGSVIRTEPKRGEPVTDETKVTIIISKGKEDVMVQMPDIVGISKDDAELKLKKLGLKLDIKSTQNSAMPANYVVSQTVTAGQDVAVGSTVYVVLSTGNAPAGIKYNVNFTFNAPTEEEYPGLGDKYRIEIYDDEHNIVYTNVDEDGEVVIQDVHVISFTTTVERGNIEVWVDGRRFEVYKYARTQVVSLGRGYEMYKGD